MAGVGVSETAAPPVPRWSGCGLTSVSFPPTPSPLTPGPGSQPAAGDSARGRGLGSSLASGCAGWLQETDACPTPGLFSKDGVIPQALSAGRRPSPVLPAARESPPAVIHVSPISLSKDDFSL